MLPRIFRATNGRAALARLARTGAAALPATIAACSAASIPPEQPVGAPSGDIVVREEADVASSAPFTEEEKAQSHGRLGGIWTSCHRAFTPAGDPAGDLARLTATCGRATGLTPLTPVRTSRALGQDDPAQRHAFQGRANRCYRVFAVGAPEIADLDVAVVDPEGRLVAIDATQDRWPLVPARGPLCLKKDGAYTVEVAVVSGTGPYALQVWAE